jgi:hypothetical protein
MLTTPEPVAKDGGGSDEAAVDISDGKVRPTPIPVITMPGSISR